MSDRLANFKLNVAGDAAEGDGAGDAGSGVLDSTEFLPCDSLENILLADSRAREKVHEMFGC